jgi:hypothetical protein
LGYRFFPDLKILILNGSPGRCLQETLAGPIKKIRPSRFSRGRFLPRGGLGMMGRAMAGRLFRLNLDGCRVMVRAGTCRDRGDTERQGSQNGYQNLS